MTKLVTGIFLLAAVFSQSALAKEAKMPHVTGIGGVFFKSKGDNKALAAWYQRHLGIQLEPWGGAVFRAADDPLKEESATAWMIDNKDSEIFRPGESSFVVNYRVDDLEGMMANLRKAGVTIVKDISVDDLGKFASVMDPEGNKLELWEPKAP